MAVKIQNSRNKLITNYFLSLCTPLPKHFQELELTKSHLINLKSKVTYANAFLSL